MTTGPVDTGENFVASEGEATAVAETPSVDNESSPPVDSSVSSDHPAWTPIIEAVPEVFRDRLRPTLQEWDKGVQQKLENTKSEYEKQLESWSDYRFIQDAGLDASTVQNAITMLSQLQQDPEAFYKALGSHYGFNAQGQPVAQTPAGTSDYDLDSDESQQSNPEVAALKAELDRVREYINSQQLSQQQQEENARLEKELSDLKQAHGDYDEEYVLGLMANGIPAVQAVQRYKALVERVTPKTNTPPGNPSPQGQATAPTVLGSGGVAPTQSPVDPKKLDAEGRKAFAIKLAQSARERN